MDEEKSRLLTFIVDTVVAFGTVGALIAALAALRYERVERRRSEVRGLRTWVRWVDPSTELDRNSLADGEPWPRNGYVPELCFQNASDEFVYDVDMTLWPTRIEEPQFSVHRMQVAPGQKDAVRLGIHVDTLHTYLKTEAGGIGVETLFRDSRGDRWSRGRDGRLARLRPMRWWAPWRVPHEVEQLDLPWWAARAHWRYRWREHRVRDIHNWPPRWWAVDIRWARWRYARNHDAVAIPVWKVGARWRARRDIAERRTRQRLPIPLWAVDEWWRHRRRWRSFARAERRRLREQRQWEKDGRPGLP